MTRTIPFLWVATLATMWTSATTALAAGPVVHELRIVHPGDPERRNLKVILEQHLDVNKEPIAYSTWVDSVICKDKTCEVVKVQLHWDALGRYQRYKVAEGSKLTKLDHVPFTAADHAKLQRILLDKDSPLREVTKEGLIGRPQAGEGVDAITRPTVLTLKNSVVIGAGYSCYDLWHWANGEVAGILRSLSGQAYSPQALEALLASKDGLAAEFALEHLTGRKLFGPETVGRVVGVLKSASADLVSPSLAYLEAALPGAPSYFAALGEVFDDCGEEKRILLLRQLTERKGSLPTGVLDRLSSSLPKFGSHHELHMFLNLVSSQEAQSTTISRNVAQLLGHRKFFVARRAYWYLEKQELPEDIQPQVDAFYRKYEDRL